MAFVTKTWKDRLVEYAGRRKLKNVATGEEVLMDVSRSEGTVSQAGDAFSAANMNNLEQRIKNEFDTVNSSLGGVSQFIVDDSTGKITGYKTKAGADTVFPFSGGNFKLVIVIRVVGQNYAGVQATKDGTITIQCIDGNITYTPAVGQSFGNSSYNIWQGDQTWTAQSASIVSVTYTPL